MNVALLEAELRRDEGVRDRPYLDTAKNPKRTVGVGHNMDASPLPASWTFPLSPSQIQQLLDKDIADTFHQLDVSLPWWRELDEVRERVVANMCFNLGISKLLTFKKALAAMERGAWLVAAAEMKDSDWYGQVGARAVRLCRAMQTGVMPA